jgi:hypothetical protein
MKRLLLIALFGLCACEAIKKPQVDAFYYPNISDMKVYKSYKNIGSVEACRDWAFDKAYENNDPNMRRGDYECAIGPKLKYGITVYDKTVS